MSGKGKQGGGSGKGKKPGRGESKSEDVLQAVVLADSFQDRFRPFTIDKPRCLLRLANTPLIEYTLEFLAMNGVQEVYIYCGAHTSQVEDYVAQSRWAAGSSRSPFSTVQFVRVADARSTGDVLRDLDKRSLVDGDFILVHGDLVSNIMLDQALDAHRKRREASAANIMTMVLTSGGEGSHRTKHKGITPIFVVDCESQQCLQYDEMNPLKSDKSFHLDPAIVQELSTEFEVRTDLIDPQIDICTPEVLALWSESFDYELPRKHFLHGVLKDWELNGKKIFADVHEEGYAARASNLQMYDSISKDIAARWTHPFIPENNLVPSQDYGERQGSVVAERTANVADSAFVFNTIIGKDSSIAANCRIESSIIGSGCEISSGATIKDSYLWDGAKVGKDSTVTYAMVGERATIGSKCNIQLGSLISHSVAIGDGIVLAENTVLSTKNADGTAVSPNTDLLGTTTNAGIFTDPELEDLDDEDPDHLLRSLIYTTEGFNISSESISTFADSDSDSEDDEVLKTGSALTSRERLSSFASDDSTGRVSFHIDATQGLLDALRAESGDFDSAKLEFMGLRLANDASDSMMRKAVATAFAKRAAELTTPEHGGLEASKAADKAFNARPGASKFVSEVGVGGGEREQVEFILALQRALLHVKGDDEKHQVKMGSLLAAMLQQLYSLDILEEEGILGWWEGDRAKDGEGMGALRERCKALVEWLESAEEEDSEEDD